MATDGPTPPPCNHEVFQNGTVVFITHSLPSNAMEGWVKKVADLSKQPVDWHFAAGRAVVKALGDLEAVHNALTQLMPEHDALRDRAIKNIIPNDAEYPDDDDAGDGGEDVCPWCGGDGTAMYLDSPEAWGGRLPERRGSLDSLSTLPWHGKGQSVQRSLTRSERVEVFLCGWGWWPGTVEQVGRLQGMDCVGVLLDGAEGQSIYRTEQVRLLDKTLHGVIGGLFEVDELFEEIGKR